MHRRVIVLIDIHCRWNWNRKTPLFVYKNIDKSLKQSNDTCFNLVFYSDRLYPNVFVPIAAIIDWYKNSGLEFKVSFNFNDKYKPYFLNNKFIEPVHIDNYNRNDISTSMDSVWKFSSDEGVEHIVTGITDSIRECDNLGKGVLCCIEWILNEIMDNVLQHSESGYGYVMAQMHRQNKHLSFCVVDLGIGIYESLKSIDNAPQDAKQALGKAVQENVTRDKSVGQGNGLWGLKNVVELNGGTLRIISNNAEYIFHDDIKISDKFIFDIGQFNNMTIIDVQINYAEDTALSAALNGHEFTDMWLDNREIGDSINISIAEESIGTGTRKAGEKMRNKIEYSLRESKKIVEVDFDNIGVISSSYADELLGKLVEKYGISYILSRMRLKNMSHEIMMIINRSVVQRMILG